MNYLQIYVLSTSILVILGRWAGDNKRLWAIEPRLRLKRTPAQARPEAETIQRTRFAYFYIQRALFRKMYLELPFFCSAHVW